MPSAKGASTQVNLLQEYAFDINFPVILHFLNLVYLIDLSTKLSKASVSHVFQLQMSAQFKELGWGRSESASPECESSECQVVLTGL